MDLESCQDKEQERRQKPPFQENDSDSLLRARESGPPEEDRYVPIPDRPREFPKLSSAVPSQEGGPAALKGSLMMQSVLFKHAITALKSVSLCSGIYRLIFKQARPVVKRKMDHKFEVSPGYI